MTAMTFTEKWDEFHKASKSLAQELGQGVRRIDERTFTVASIHVADKDHTVRVALDGSLVCDCEASAFERECYAVKAVRKELDMSETALVPVKVQLPTVPLPTLQDLALIERAASMVFEGRVALPKELDSPKKVAAVMLYGWELGLKPMTAIRMIDFIEGRPEPRTEVLVGLAMEAEPNIRFIPIESTDHKCTMRFIRPNRGYDERFSVSTDDADVKLLIKRDTPRAGEEWKAGAWVKYPRDRLRWHCTKRILRIFAPDLKNGLRGVIFDEPLANEPDRSEAIDPEALYNEGDGPDESMGAAQQPEGDSPRPQSPGVPAEPPRQEPSLGEIATAKEKALAVLTDIKDGFPPETYALVRGTIEARWPETTTAGGKFYPTRVKDESALALLAYVEAVRRQGDAEPKEEGEPAAVALPFE